MKTDKDKKLPKFALCAGTAMRLIGENRYYRDGGQWGIDVKWVNDELLTWFWYPSEFRYLHRRPVVEITEEEWRKSNGVYAPKNLHNEMKLFEVENIDDIKEGDTICITSNEYHAEPFKVKKVKVSKSDGTEIIIDMKKNLYFNLGMYLDGNSWVKEVVIIK